ncbi:cytochrome P450 [Ramicandelaber brevisporus]|nr:cytochrome P450 [Ramicandelaber brevisporus]
MGVLVDMVVGIFKPIIDALGGLPCAILLTITAYVLYVGIYNRYFHPLRDVPGPVWGSMFPGMYLIDSLLKRSPFRMLELHEKYGPVVRYEPNELSFADSASLRTIYSTHSFVKTPHYHDFDIADHEQIFSTTDPEVSKKHKRMLGPTFGAPNIAQLEELIHDVGPKVMVDRLKLQYSKQGGKYMKVDLVNTFFESTFGVIGRLVFGQQLIYADDAEGGEFSRRVVQLIKDMSMGFYMQALFPRWSWELARDVLGVKPLVELKELTGYAMDAVKQRREEVRAGEKVDSDMLQMIMDAADPETGDTLNDSEIVAANMILIFAGSDTSANTLAWTFDLLFQHPAAMARLESEVLSAFPDMSERISFRAAKDTLHYLDAVLLESMRMRSVAGDILHRHVPDGGRQIGGYHVPAGTTVGVASFVHHNYSQYWDEPLKFKPERFLEGTPEDIAARRQMVIPFSIGVRSCIGRTLAIVELVVNLATIIQQFEIRPAEEPYKPLEMESAFVIGAKSNMLMAKIRPRS